MILGCEPESWLPVSEDKIVDVVTDMRLAREITRTHSFQDQDSVYRSLVDHIYQVHEISQKDYDRIMTYLQNNDSEFIKIEGKIKERFEKKSSEKEPSRKQED